MSVSNFSINISKISINEPKILVSVSKNKPVLSYLTFFKARRKQNFVLLAIFFILYGFLFFLICVWIYGYSYCTAPHVGLKWHIIVSIFSHHWYIDVPLSIIHIYLCDFERWFSVIINLMFSRSFILLCCPSKFIHE